eukprot:PITA_23005
MATEIRPAVDQVCGKWRSGITEAHQKINIVFCVCLVFLLSYIAVSRSGDIFTPGFWFTSKINPLSKPVKHPLLSNNADDLEIALAKASMPNKTLIMTAANTAWMEPNGLIDLLLESFRIGEGTQELLDYLLIVALDERAFNRCKEIHLHCYELRTEGVDFSGEKFFMTKDYVKITQRKIEFLKDVVEHGFSFVFTVSLPNLSRTYADIVWLRNPFKRFSREADFQISCDTCDYGPADLRNFPNTGFAFVRSNQQTIRLYNLWYNFTQRYPGRHDQDAFNAMKFSKEFANIGLKPLHLDAAYFSGFCDTRATLQYVCTMHANCCKGLKAKTHDLRATLEKWMLYRLDVGRRSEIHWRSRDECRRSLR